MAEPIFFVVERGAGGAEVAVIYWDFLPGRLKRKPAPMIYALRLDRLDPEHREFWLRKPTSELLATYRWLRDEGTLPATNLADPPRKTEGQKGRLSGPEHWWQPLPLPRAEG